MRGAREPGESSPGDLPAHRRETYLPEMQAHVRQRYRVHRKTDRLDDGFVLNDTVEFVCETLRKENIQQMIKPDLC